MAFQAEPSSARSKSSAKGAWMGADLPWQPAADARQPRDPREPGAIPFHASPLARIQRHRGGIRQNLQTRLCSAVDLADAETLIALLPAWFEDYNEVHPHSGLKFLSPREFLRLSA